MPTPKEKIAEIQQRLNSNIQKVQQLQAEIKAKQEEAATFTQPILEDQGALKALQELVGDTLEAPTES
jgi:peptidoglycan hydrolase CwlO-like protein